MASVQCCNCGYLSVHNPNTFTLEESIQDERKTGTFRRSTLIFCFVRAFDLQAEREMLGKDGKNRTAPLMLEVITSDRECAKFCEWNQGFSPKEHREMQIESEMRKWQEQRLEDDRKRQEEQLAISSKRDEERREADRKFQQESKESDRKHQEELAIKSFRRTLIAAAFGALFTACIGHFMKKNEDVRPIIIQIPDSKETKSK